MTTSLSKKLFKKQKLVKTPEEINFNKIKEEDKDKKVDFNKLVPHNLILQLLIIFLRP